MPTNSKIKRETMDRYWILQSVTDCGRFYGQQQQAINHNKEH